MNIVFAYHSGDCELAVLSAKAIVSHGMNMRHKATICCVEDTPFIYEITEELKKAFPEVNRIFAQDGFNGWPLGPNQMFSDASTYCYRYQDPWYFWEPDCVPMVSGWVDKLEEEFKKEPNKIMGSLIDGGTAPSGKNVYKLLVGSAVYPSKFLDYCGLAASLCNYNIAYRQAGTIPEPWDVRCRWVFMQHGRNTDLIKAYWNSCDYQYKGNDLVFSAQNPEAQEIQSVTCPERKVDPKAIVVHGCKDGSLHKMVVAGMDKFAKKDELKPKPAVKSPSKTSKAKKAKIQEPEDFIKQLQDLASNLKNPAKKKKKKTEQIAQDAV
jgi:hypothetical protein